MHVRWNVCLPNPDYEFESYSAKLHARWPSDANVPHVFSNKRNHHEDEGNKLILIAFFNGESKLMSSGIQTFPQPQDNEVRWLKNVRSRTPNSSQLVGDSAAHDHQAIRHATQAGRTCVRHDPESDTHFGPRTYRLEQRSGAGRRRDGYRPRVEAPEPRVRLQRELDRLLGQREKQRSVHSSAAANNNSGHVYSEVQKL